MADVVKVDTFRPNASSGQATVEAAFLIPIMCALLLILLQPSLLLLNRLVMEMTANDVCRFVMTQDCAGMQSHPYNEAELYALRRLDAIPSVSILHEDPWIVEIQGDECLGDVKIHIEHKVKPLPLLQVGLGFGGVLDSEGLLTQQLDRRRILHSDFECEIGLEPLNWVAQREGVSCTS